MISFMKCVFSTRICTAIGEKSGLCNCKVKRPVILLTANDIKRIHTSIYLKKQKDNEEAETNVTVHSFESLKDKQKESYIEILNAYIKYNPSRRGHLEFIRAGMKYMDEFGVNKDLECYKYLLNVLPKGTFVPTNYFQIVLDHYPKQQQLIIDLLSKMEYNGVIPDRHMQQDLIDRFGRHGNPVKRYYRMMYWMPKFKNINPWPVPKPVPRDPRDLARFAITRMSSVDVQTEISEFETKHVDEAIDHTWIVSAMSPLQKTLLQMHDVKTPLYVEGPFTVWCANYVITYFVLKADPVRKEYPYQDLDDVSDIRIPFWDKKEIALPRAVHEQNDGTYLAMCATGTSSNDSVLSWVRCLQETNPALSKRTVVFRLTTYTDDTDEYGRDKLHHPINLRIVDDATELTKNSSSHRKQ